MSVVGFGFGFGPAVRSILTIERAISDAFISAFVNNGQFAPHLPKPL